MKKTVKIILQFFDVFPHQNPLIQVYLVTGGYYWSNNIHIQLSSTEILVDGASFWTNVGKLPVAMELLRGVSWNNNIFMTGHIFIHVQFSHNNSYVLGGYDGDSNHDCILKFNPDEGSWSKVGQLKHGRSAHGASIVGVNDIIDYCNQLNFHFNKIHLTPSLTGVKKNKVWRTIFTSWHL